MEKIWGTFVKVLGFRERGIYMVLILCEVVGVVRVVRLFLYKIKEKIWFQKSVFSSHYWKDVFSYH